MIRRFNYTNRIRIHRKDIRISLRVTDKSILFDADLSKLAEYGLPPESFVFVEAYRQTNWMRFNFGRVGAIEPDKDRELKTFNSPEGILFRIKVTPSGDTHTLLAEADRIPLVQPDQQQVPRISLLPVKPEKLGDEIYCVDFSGDHPLLLINSDAGNCNDIAKSPAFVSLGYPAIFKEILIRILLIEKHDDDSNPDEWKSLWVKFASTLPGIGELPQLDDLDGRADWIDKAVAAFANRIQARAKFGGFWKENI